MNEQHAANPEHKILFVTGKLAEPALRRILAELAPQAGFHYDVAVMPITVAALLTTPWIAKRLHVPSGITRVVLPGLCSGDLSAVQTITNIPVSLGPKDLRELPEFFGKKSGPPLGYGKFEIEILAEINHAPRKTLTELVRIAQHYRTSGADIIDLGCDPANTWSGIGDCVRALRDDGYRVSVDSFNPIEVVAALQAGAELVLSVNGSNLKHVPNWAGLCPGVEVVAIPDTPADLDSLHRTVEQLQNWGVKHRLDPIVEPIGFGFAASLGRYLATRQRYPDAEIMMGVGNLTELTDCDTAGINVLLAGFCQELGIRSVLATEVINWGRSAIQEFSLARRLVHHAVTNKVVPKRLEPNLVLLRDPKLYEQGEQELAELAQRITDRNYRIFAERGELHVMNGEYYLRGTDPFELFNQMQKRDAKLDLSHSFYLGYEFAKAITALTLGKNYEQDRALRWGFLSVPETSHRNSGIQE
jgi:dihydropteroate synthase-like protein